MLASMRKGVSTIFAKIILGFLILTFAVWGVGDTIRSHGSNMNVATVGPRNITALEFERDLKREEDTFRQRLGKQYNPMLLRVMHVPEQLLGRIINEELYALEAADLGLIPSDDAVAANIRENPMFRGLTSFESAKFKEFLMRASLSENDYVKALKRDMGIKLLFATYNLKPTPLPFSVQLADAMTRETRDIALYTISASAVKAPDAPTTEQLTETYQAHVKEFIKPETREASVAVIEKSSEEGVTQASNHMEDLLAGGETFANAAREVGATLSRLPAITRDGKLMNGEKAGLPALENLVANIYATDQGSESNVTSGGNGRMYMVHVDKVTPEGVPPLADVRPAIEKIWRKEQTEKAVAKLAYSVADRLRNEKTRAQTISEHHLVASNRALFREGPGLPAELIAEAYGLDAGKATAAHPTNDGDYVIAVVTGIPAVPIATYTSKSPNNERLKSEMTQEQLQLFGAYLRKKYNVTVNDDVLTKLLERDQ